MVAENNLRQIRLVIYKLKRSYGLNMTIFNPVSQSHNVETGVVTRSFDELIVRKAILLPKQLTRSFVYDLAFIAAAKNFTGGGYFDQDQRTVIIDARDVPTDFEPTIDMHLQVNVDNIPPERFEIQKVERAENRKAYLLTVKAVSNADVI